MTAEPTAGQATEDQAGLAGLLDLLRPAGSGAGRYTARSFPLGGRVVFGGQLMAQAIAVADDVQPGKSVLTVHTTFTRGGDPSIPLEIQADELLAGRSFGAVTVTFRQRDKVVARAQVQLSRDEEDVIRHAPPAPAVPGPDPLTAGPTHGFPDWETDVVGGTDVMAVDQVLPARLALWSRWPTAPDDPVVGRQLLAWASDPWLIGTAMLPHAGFGQDRAHDDLSTGVITHTITFHEDPHAASWLLLDQEVPWAGAGRLAGRAQVFTADGHHVASFSQDAMIRRPPQAGFDPAHARVL